MYQFRTFYHSSQNYRGFTTYKTFSSSLVDSPSEEDFNQLSVEEDGTSDDEEGILLSSDSDEDSESDSTSDSETLGCISSPFPYGVRRFHFLPLLLN